MGEKASKDAPPRPSSARWQILRRALRVSEQTENPLHAGLEYISRKPINGFNMIPFHVDVAHSTQSSDGTVDGCILKETRVSYTLPVETSPKIHLFQRTGNFVSLNDFEISNRYNIDNTGLVCSWPSEDVLAHFCLNHVKMFRSKKVLELGSGYGLAGFAIAAGTDACEVVISDGNPQVVDYIKSNISANVGVFGNTIVKSMLIHWNLEPDSSLLNHFDIIVASDCTFFKDFHESLAVVVKSLLKKSEASEAIFLNPRRGDSLDIFLQKLDMVGLQYKLVENYDSEIWSRHLKFINANDDSWPNYDKDHCYPLLTRITFKEHVFT